MQTCTTPARRGVSQRVDAGRFSRFGLHLIGECGAPDTPASQPGFSGNISMTKYAVLIIGRAFARPVGYCALRRSIMPAHQQKARREAGALVTMARRSVLRSAGRPNCRWTPTHRKAIEE